MIHFIRYNLARLFSWQHAFVMIVYLSFSWFLCQPIPSTAVYSSRELTGNYELILLSFVYLNFVLFMASNFKEELSKGRKDFLLTKLSSWKLLFAFLISYCIYWAVGFALPTYMTALIQQVYYAPHCIKAGVFAVKFLCSLVGYPFFLITVSLFLFSILKNEFVFLIIVMCFMAIFHVVGLATNHQVWNYFWLSDICNDDLSIPTILLMGGSVLISMLAGVLGTVYVSSRVRDLIFAEKMNNGLLVRTSRWLKAELSMYHYKMLGLADSKILYFFSFLGLVLVLLLVRAENADFRLLVRLYIGAVLPCLFALNQYNIVKIDIEAGMLHNNFLRKMPFHRIIMNRWLINFIPQAAVLSVCFMILFLSNAGVPLYLYWYTILLSILFSQINLLSGLFLKTGMAANLFLIFVAYIQLRDDVQAFLSNNGFESINIMHTFTGADPSTVHWVILIGLVVLFFVVTQRELRVIRYAAM